MRAALSIVLLALTVNTGLSQSALDVSKLHDDLLTLRPTVRPVHDFTQPTEVMVTFHLTSIISLDTVSQTLVSNGWMSVVWHNPYMTWDTADYGGVISINPPAEQMWRPRLTVQNTLKELKPVGEDYVTLTVHSNGFVVWYPAELFETFCQIDVTYFPFDLQRCQLRLFDWVSDVSAVVLLGTMPSIVLDSYHGNGEWILVSSKAWNSSILEDSRNFSMVVYEVTLRRRPTLLVLTVILPIFVLSIINVYVFTIPSEAGERLSYSVTSFLSFLVFLSFMVDLMPSSTESLSILAVVMAGQLILSALYVLLCILSLRLFHRDPHHHHPVPPSIQTFIVCLELMLCLGPSSSPQHPPPPSTSSLPLQSLIDSVSSAGSGDVYGDVGGGGGGGGGAEVEVRGGWLKGQVTRWALRRKVRQEDYSRPQGMSWQRVSRSLDRLLFRLFFCLVMLITVAYSAAMVYTNYCGSV